MPRINEYGYSAIQVKKSIEHYDAHNATPVLKKTVECFKELDESSQENICYLLIELMASIQEKRNRATGEKAHFGPITALELVGSILLAGWRLDGSRNGHKKIIRLKPRPMLVIECHNCWEVMSSCEPITWCPFCRSFNVEVIDV